MHYSPTRLRSVISLLLFLLVACGALIAQGQDAKPAKTGLELTLDVPMKPVRPGEVVTIPYTITNKQPQPMLLAVNQGNVGGHYAAKTLTHRLVDVVTGEVINEPQRGGKGCPVGEGLQQRHFHKLASGKEQSGVIQLRWGPYYSPVVPAELPRDRYRLEVTYARPEGMEPGQVDDEASKQLWKDADSITSNTATAILQIAPWDDAALDELQERIAVGDSGAMQTARVAKLDSVFPAVERALFNFDALPLGHHYDFRMSAVRYLKVIPFPLASAPLLRILKGEDFDGVYQIKHQAIFVLGSYPREIVGPWAVEQFNKHDDRMLRDKLLGVLSQCKFNTNDEVVVAYMLNEVREANPDRFSSATASYILSACEAIGGKNSHAVVLAIRDRLGDIKSNDQYDRCLERINTLIAIAEAP